MINVRYFYSLIKLVLRLAQKLNHGIAVQLSAVKQHTKFFQLFSEKQAPFMKRPFHDIIIAATPNLKPAFWLSANERY
jgi:hypothetical protein